MYGSDHLQRFIRSRTVRIALALLLVALSAWAFVPYVTYRIAPSAFVNAELLRVAAPIAGQLAQDLPHKGEFVSAPVTVGLITSLSPDRRHLLDLDSELAVAKERAALARKQLDEITATDAELEKRVETYRDWVVKIIADDLAEAEAATKRCLLETHQRQGVGSQLGKPAPAGGTSQPTDTPTAQQATLRCETAQTRWRRLQRELASAKNGIFLRDGANDVPYSQQQRDRLLLRRQELEIMVLEGDARSLKLATEIIEERERVNRLTHADLTLPQAHVVWSVSASPGSTVTEGQTLLDLADCANRFVAVELPERDFERIKAGDAAYVRLIGSDDWKLGQVRRVRGSAARIDDRLLAARVPNPDAGSITVEVSLPPDEALADRNNFCNIGRLAEVRFQRSHFAFLDSLRRAFGLPMSLFERSAAAAIASD
ncbi:MAG TPA: HlyD family efflux transporter periplasmic adaptor subunit [Xanthobacteraceae bacterium]|nr:HlyD family efflux transporter periplasmic adaptor subunit [Xanthobacteraceae bacterium]